MLFFFLNVLAPPELYTLSLHDALPIYARAAGGARSGQSVWRVTRRGGPIHKAAAAPAGARHSFGDSRSAGVPQPPRARRALENGPASSLAARRPATASRDSSLRHSDFGAPADVADASGTGDKRDRGDTVRHERHRSAWPDQDGSARTAWFHDTVAGIGQRGE